MAVLAEHRRYGLVKERKIEVRDVHEFEFGVIAFSRNVVSPLAHGLALPTGPRTTYDDCDFKHNSPSVRLCGDQQLATSSVSHASWSTPVSARFLCRETHSRM